VHNSVSEKRGFCPIRRPLALAFIFRIDTPVTKLLVSVRNVGEARAAIAGGADVVDVKEPSRGSLGMADSETIGAIVRSVSAATVGNTPVSAALGEAHEWLNAEELPELPAGLTYCKLGLSGLARDSNWTAAWLAVRDRFEQHSFQERPENSFGWIAVAYVDWSQAAGPPPEEVVEAAAGTGCAGVLLDTYHKDGRSLLDWISVDDLSRLSKRIRAGGMVCAVAGGLRREMVGTLTPVAADILAVRTAACEDGRRTGKVTESAVLRFKSAMQPALRPAANLPRQNRRPAG
jgi:hypothetical protein